MSSERADSIEDLPIKNILVVKNPKSCAPNINNFEVDDEKNYDRRKTTMLRANFLVDSKMSRKLKEIDQDLKEQHQGKEEKIVQLTCELKEKNMVITDYKTRLELSLYQLDSLKSIIEESENIETNWEEKNFLKEKLKQKENELDILKGEISLKFNKYIDEISQLKQKEEQYIEKLQDYKDIKEKNIHISQQLVDLEKYKNKVQDYDNLVVTLKTFRIKVKNYKHEIGSYKLNIDKLIKELNDEKEKSMKIESNRKFLEIQLKDLNDTLVRIKNENTQFNLKSDRIGKLPNLLRRVSSRLILTDGLMPDRSLQHGDSQNILRLPINSFIEESMFNQDEYEQEIEANSKKIETLTKELEACKKEIERVKLEKADIIKTSGEQSNHIFKLIEQRDDYLKEIDNFKDEILKFSREKEDFLTEIENFSSKLTEKSNLISLLEEEVLFLHNEVNDHKFKIDILAKEKENSLKDYNHLRRKSICQNINNTRDDNFDKLITIKNSIITENEKTRADNKSIEPTPNFFNLNKNDDNRENIQSNCNDIQNLILLPYERQTSNRTNSLTGVNLLNENEVKSKDIIGEIDKISKDNFFEILIQNLKVENEKLKNEIHIINKELSQFKLECQTQLNENSNLKVTW